MAKQQTKQAMCGKRTARFVCTLSAGHAGPHGRAYRRVSPEQPVHLRTSPSGTACGRGVEEQHDLWTILWAKVTCPRCLETR